MPRAFVRGALKRAGLDTGDVVTLADAGVPYAAVSLCGGGGGDDDAAPGVHWVLEPRPGSGFGSFGGGGGSAGARGVLDADALLEVVRQARGMRGEGGGG